MTVQTQTNIVFHDGDGLATNFPFKFPVYEADHLQVMLYQISTDTLTTLLPAAYTTSGIGPRATEGSVTYNPGPPISNDYQLVIARVVPELQQADIYNQDGFYPEVIETQLDLIVMMLQQAQSKLDRALTVPLIEQEGFDIPALDDRKGKLLGFDISGNPLPVSPAGGGISTTDILDSGAFGRQMLQTNTLGDAQNLIGFYSSAALTPERYGAKGDGVTVDQTALVTMAAQALITGLPVVCDGKYVSDANIPNWNSIKKFGGGTIIADGISMPITGVGSTGRNLYVSTTGLDTNDGLSPSRPLAGVKFAADCIASYVATTGIFGQWFINLAAGTYTENAQTLAFLYLPWYVNVVGPVRVHPLEPQVWFDGASAASFCFAAYRSTYLFRNIGWKNFTGTPVTFSQQAFGYLDNCWLWKCGQAVLASNGTLFFFRGGLVGEMSGDGIVINTNSHATVGYSPPTPTNLHTIASFTMTSGAGQTVATSDVNLTGLTGYYVFGKGITFGTTIQSVGGGGTTITLSTGTTADWATGRSVVICPANSGTIIFSCAGGNGAVYTAENSACHLDWTGITDCSVGETLLDSRSNIASSVIEKNTVGLWRRGGDWAETGLTSIKNNTRNYKSGESGNITISSAADDNTLFTPATRVKGWSAAIPRILGTGSLVRSSFSGNLIRVNPNWFRDRGAAIIVESFWTINGHGGAIAVSASGMSVDVQFDTTNVALLGIASGTAAGALLFCRHTILARGQASQFGRTESILNTVARVGLVNATYAMGTNPATGPMLTIGGSITAAADSLLLEDYQVKFEGL